MTPIFLLCLMPLPKTPNNQQIMVTAAGNGVCVREVRGMGGVGGVGRSGMKRDTKMTMIR